MARGRLEPPNLDDRTWRDIVEQAKALIPRYTPEWTDHNPSDLGIALIELFAWIAESMIYRLNRVPEKNFIEFLNLLGITCDPATPASTFLTYSLAPNASPVMVSKGHQVATPQTETEEAVIFETDHDLKVLPINLTTAVLFKEGNFSQYENITTALVDSPVSGQKISIVQNKPIFIALGFDAITTEKISLLCHFSKPAKKDELKLTWYYSSATATPTNWTAIAPANVSDGTEGFQKNNIVSLNIPANWTAQNPKKWAEISTATNPVDQPLFWIGLKIEIKEPKVTQPVEVGIEHILCNSVSATNALTIKEELLGVSDGKSFQLFELKNRPLFKRPKAKQPYAHLKIEVREPKEIVGGFGDWTPWTYQDDFPLGEGKYFSIDPVTGTIKFGNYHPSTSLDGHGSIPIAGSEIRAEYRYVAGGAKGNLPPRSITVNRIPISGLTEVKNLVVAMGGSDEEAIEETKRRAPEVLRNRYRAITVEDYEYLAKEASGEVKKVRCLAPRRFTFYDGLPINDPKLDKPWNYGGLNRSTGTINVIIIPNFQTSPALSSQELIKGEPRPTPSNELLAEIKEYLDTRRPLTSNLNVTAPRYLPIAVEVDIKIWQRVFNENILNPEEFKKNIEDKIQEFLHPLLGGLDKKGWEVGQEITVSDLFKILQPETDIGFISRLQIKTETPLYQPTNRPNQDEGNRLSAWVRVADYEIICSGTPKVLVEGLG